MTSKRKTNVSSFFGLLLFILCLVWACKEPRELQSDNLIVSFSLKSVAVASVNINHESGLVSIVVPYGAVLSEVVPEIGLSQGASVVPAASIAQNFSKDIHYTVSAANGAKKVYKVVISRLAQSVPVVSLVSSESIRAGEHILITGSEFGNFNLAVKVYLRDQSGKSEQINSRLVDSTKIDAGVPSELKPGLYSIYVTKNGLESVSDKKILIKIPAPEISAVKSANLLQGDSMVLTGKYIEASGYSYQLKMVSGTQTYLLTPAVVQSEKLSFLTTGSISPANYNIALVNTGDSVTGPMMPESIRIYDNQLPFVRYTVSSLSKPGEAVTFSTKNFADLPTRFYQLELTADGRQYNQNGIYHTTDQKLGFELPPGIKPGGYRAKVIFLSDQGQHLYDVALDGLLTVVE